MKRLIAVLLMVAICFSFGSCSMLYDYELDAINGFDVGYSDTLNQAFLSTYNWDGTDEAAKLVVPNEYDGMLITEFGGFYGRGVPCSFSIEPTDEAKEKLCQKSDKWFYLSDIRRLEIGEMKTIYFDIHISKNICKIEKMALGGFIGCRYMEDNIEYHDVFVLLCTVTCDEENETFYAKDGKLYTRHGDSLVENIFYYDFDIEQYMGEEADEYCVCTAF